MYIYIHMYIFIYIYIGGVYFVAFNHLCIEVIPQNWCRGVSITHLGGQHKTAISLFLSLSLSLPLSLYIYRLDGRADSG